jgi:hypothetical protein
METQKQETLPEFDFKKPHTVVAAVEKQSYKKLSFVTFLLTLFLSTGIVGGKFIVNKASPQPVKTVAISKQQEKLVVQQIKQMDKKEFINMLAYINKNISVYDEKVDFVRNAIVKANLESSYSSLNPSHTKNLVEELNQYKEQMKEDIARLNQVKLSIENNIEVSNDDIGFFFKYLTSYRSKIILNNKDLDEKIHFLVFTNASGNKEYNQQHNVYETLKNFDIPLEKFDFYAPVITENKS